MKSFLQIRLETLTEGWKDGHPSDWVGTCVKHVGGFGVVKQDFGSHVLINNGLSNYPVAKSEVTAHHDEERKRYTDMDEETITEISKKTLDNYRWKAQVSGIKHAVDYANQYGIDNISAEKHKKMADKRAKGVALANKKLKEESLTEGAHNYNANFPIDKFPTVKHVQDHINNVHRSGFKHGEGGAYDEDTQLSRAKVEHHQTPHTDLNKIHDYHLDHTKKWGPLHAHKGKTHWHVGGWIAESIMNEEEATHVVIGNAGRGRQNAWPKSDEPKLYTPTEAKGIVDKLNASERQYSTPGGGTHYHAQHIKDAHKYVAPGNVAHGGIMRLRKQHGITEAHTGPTRMELQKTYDNTFTHSPGWTMAQRITHVEKAHNVKNVKLYHHALVGHPTPEKLSTISHFELNEDMIIDEGRITKAGQINNHPWVGKKVKYFHPETNSYKTGTVHSVHREHTFSQLVPFKTELHIRDDAGEFHIVRKDRAKTLKEDMIIDEGKRKKFLGQFRGYTATGSKANPIDTKPTLKLNKSKAISALGNRGR